jgi:hypothetical protein
VVKSNGLASSHGCSLYKTTSFVYAVAYAFQVIPFDNEGFDTDNYHDNVTNNSRVTIPTGLGGKYLITAYEANVTTHDAAKRLQVKINGVAVTSANGGYQISGDLAFKGNATGQADEINGSGIFTLNAGDYIELFVSVDTAKTYNQDASFQVAYLGA